MKLPDCNELFDRFFMPHVSDDEQAHEPRGVRGDLEEYAWLKGRPASELCELTDESRKFIADHLVVMRNAVLEDFPRYLDVELPFGINWIEAFEQHWAVPAICTVIKEADPKDFANDYLVACCELGVALGSLLMEAEPAAQWVEESPYFDSFIWHPPSATRANVFSWAIKKMSAYAVDDPVGAKVDWALTIFRKRAKAK